MRFRAMALALTLFLSLALVAATNPGKVSGTFIVAGTDAQLKHVRAKRVKLDDKGQMGYAVLMSAKPATGDIEAWRTADPQERGSYVHVIFDSKGEIWIAELGHVRAKTRPFGVMTEIRKVAFEVTGEQISGHIRTEGEQVFTDDHYSVDLTFQAPLERE